MRRTKKQIENETLRKASEILEARARLQGLAITTAEAAYDIFIPRLQLLEREVFCCLWLTQQHRVIHVTTPFLGTIASCEIRPREIVKEALTANAASVIFAHNHPSGIAEPSVSDIRITETLQSAMGLIDVRVLDHIIIGHGAPTSMAEKGLIK
jgi:DNA repair protein RadC